MQAMLADEIPDAQAVDAQIQHKSVVRRSARGLDPAHARAYDFLQAKTGGAVAAGVVVGRAVVGRNEHRQGEAHLLDSKFNVGARVGGAGGDAGCEALAR